MLRDKHGPDDLTLPFACDPLGRGSHQHIQTPPNLYSTSSSCPGSFALRERSLTTQYYTHPLLTLLIDGKF